VSPTMERGGRRSPNPSGSGSCSITTPGEAARPWTTKVSAKYSPPVHFMESEFSLFGDCPSQALVHYGYSLSRDSSPLWYPQIMVQVGISHHDRGGGTEATWFLLANSTIARIISSLYITGVVVEREVAAEQIASVVTAVGCPHNGVHVKRLG